MPRLTDTPDVHIDSVHSRAICDEVGYRLGRSFTANPVEDPRHRQQLDRMSRMELNQQHSGASADDGASARGFFRNWTAKTWTPLRRRG
jgi:hypothetical protein